MSDWFKVLESTTLVVGVFFAALKVHQNTKTQQISNLLILSNASKALWELPLQYPVLERMFDAKADLVSVPVRPAETYYFKIILLNFYTAYLSEKSNQFRFYHPGVREDLKDFFTLPIPRQLWKEAQKYYRKDFVNFINRNSRHTQNTDST